MALKQLKLLEELGIHLRDIYVINGKAVGRKGWVGEGGRGGGVGGGRGTGGEERVGLSNCVRKNNKFGKHSDVYEPIWF